MNFNEKNINTQNNNLYNLIARNIKPKNTSIFLLIFSILFILIINITYINTPILEHHAFRQTQTALTAYYLKKNGFSFQYETPVIGEGWSIPFEFPIYQEIVSLLSNIFNVDIIISGRLVSLIFLLLCCIPINACLKRFYFSVTTRNFVLSLFLSSPIYIFWAGSFMVESTALFFSLCFLYYSLCIIEKEYNNKNIIFLFLFLSLALLQKITTVAPPLLLVLFIIIFFTIYPSDFENNKINIFKIISGFLFALFIGLIWVRYTDHIKAANPIGEHLMSSKLVGWNFGSLKQRLDENFWIWNIYHRNIEANSLYYIGLIAIVLSFFTNSNKIFKLFIISLVYLFLSPFLIFTNLHYVHDYYQNANSVFLSVAVGLSICYLGDKYLSKRNFLYSLVMMAFIVSNYIFFKKDLYIVKSSKIDITNNRTLQIAGFIKEHTPADSPIIIYGYDWSSEVALYSERKSLTLPWGTWDLESLESTNKFLSKPPSAIALCPNPNFDLIKKQISLKYPAATSSKINDCDIYLLNK